MIEKKTSLDIWNELEEKNNVQISKVWISKESLIKLLKEWYKIPEDENLFFQINKLIKELEGEEDDSRR